MNSKPVKHSTGLATIAVLASLAWASPGMGADDIFRMQVHPKEIAGTWEIVNGKYERAIPLLEIAAARASRSARQQGPILTNLCVAHTKLGNYEIATSYCDRAVESSFEFGVAHNNRGVLEALKRNFAQAAADFAVARTRRESAESAEFNIKRLGETISEYDGDSPPDVSRDPVV